jgi:shikimate 5-dehydrogenase
VINKNTKIFFSISSNPGNFGATFFNIAFEELGIDAFYKPLKLNDSYLNTSKFSKFLETNKEMGTSGISVSMPFKKVASLDTNMEKHDKKTLREIGNVNTLVYKEKVFPYCYNTDYIAFEKSCENILKKTKTAFIFGNGAVSNSISYVLEKRGIEYKKNKKYFKEADLLINATPIGMIEDDETLFTKEVVETYKYVFDVVANNKTNLIKNAKELKKEYIIGSKMQFENAIQQLKIYTNEEVDREIMLKKMRERGYEIY